MDAEGGEGGGDIAFELIYIYITSGERVNG